jgi:putative endonuclease
VTDTPIACAWQVYVLRCADDTLYTGITTDIVRRLAEHNGEDAGGARYTRSRRPVALAYLESVATRAEAARREGAIKRLDRAAKLALCASFAGWRSGGQLSGAPAQA